MDVSLTSEAKLTPNRTSKSLSKHYEKRFKEGYDSDGGCGPFFDCIDKEGDQVFNEADLPDLRHMIQDKKTETETETETVTDSEDEVDLIEPAIFPTHVPIEASALSNMKVTDIRAHLKMRNIVAKGKKVDIIA